jgi:hypothetical protein
VDILFENDPEHYKSERRVVFDECFKTSGPYIFQDPFADLLDLFNGGTCYVMDILSQELRKSLKIHDQQHFRWKLSVSFFSLLKESVSRFQISRQFLDWLHWHFCII